MKPKESVLHNPFVYILAIIVTAIFLSTYVRISMWAWLALTVAFGALSVVWYRHNASWIYVGLTILCFTGCSVEFNHVRDALPQDAHVAVAMRVTDNPVRSGRWDRATAVVERYNTDEGEEWIRAREKVVARFDTTYNAEAGNRILATARISPIGDPKGTYGGYVRLMRVRGYGAAVWVGESESYEVLPGRARGLSVMSARMQSAANERIDRLTLSDGARGVVKGMSVGMRSEIDQQLRESYNITGAAHLLSVSGLHVGIVLMLVNALLYLFPLFRRGHVIRGVVAVMAIWLYAMMTGMSAPVIRASIMFTGVQIALSMSRPGGGMNALLGTAAIMLLINPNYLFDVSFQMSYVAMLGIFSLYRPLYSLVYSRMRWVNCLWGLVLIGFAAGIATMPVVAYYFGRVSFIGPFLNPIVVFAANVIVFLSILWVLFPIGFLTAPFSALLGWAGDFQNNVIDYAASLPWASAEVDMNGAQLAAAYIALALIAVAVNIFARKRELRRESLFSDDE